MINFSGSAKIPASTTQSSSSLPSFTTATKNLTPKCFGAYIYSIGKMKHHIVDYMFCLPLHPTLGILVPLYIYIELYIYIYVCVCDYATIYIYTHIRTSLQVSSTNFLICYWYIYHRCIPFFHTKHSPSSAPVRSCAMHRHRTGRRTWGTSQLGAWKMRRWESSAF